MKRILLLTDFSDAAFNAIQFALKFWSGTQCEFYLMHIEDSASFTTDNLISQPSSVSIYDTLVTDSKNKLKSIEEDLKAEHASENYSFKSSVDVDSFTDAINQAIELYQIEYVVIGSNGASNAKEVIFGSHALMVMRQLNCNVLVVPEAYKFTSIKEALIVLDENDSLTDSVLNNLEYLKRLTQSSFNIVRMSSGKAILNDKKHLGSIFKKDDYSYSRILDIPTSYAVDTIVQTNDIGLIVIPGNFNSFLDRMRGKTSKTDISKLYKLPLLALRT